MKLPLELRLEIFRYLLPSRPVGSSTSLLHIDEEADQQQPWYHSTSPPRFGPASNGRNSQNPISASTLDRSTIRSVFAVPLTSLLLINHQIHDEVKDLFYSSVPFTIDIRKDGTFMCGRRLLEPRRADGSSHYIIGDVKKIKETFIRTFNWGAVKNYNVDILVENWKDDHNRGSHFPWDEEVEIYDIRDYIGVVVTGILSKARNLCKLNVRLGFSKFLWTEQELQNNVRTLVGPFERLRNVRQPRLLGIYEGTPQTNFMISLPIPSQANILPSLGQTHTRPATPLCSVPQLPDKVALLISEHPNFIEYRSNWERWISSPCVTTLVVHPPIRAMFTELKDFYTRLAATVPDVTARPGRRSFLHRARVAREQENVEAFRDLRNELIGYWEAYLEQEERKKADMSRRLSKMLDADVYPPTWDDEHACIASRLDQTTPGSDPQSPIITDHESWHNAASRAQQAQPTTLQGSSLDRTRAISQTNIPKPTTSSNRESPVVIDMTEDDNQDCQAIAVEQPQHSSKHGQQPPTTHAGTRLQHDNPSLEHPIAPQVMISAGSQVSPSGSHEALQSPRDQQHMALNPQPHLQEAMSHRRQTIQEAMLHREQTAFRLYEHIVRRQNELDQAQTAEADTHGQSTFSPKPHPQGTASLSMPMPQMPSQLCDVLVHEQSNDPQVEASSSFMPDIVPTRIETLYHQQEGTSDFTASPIYNANWNVTIPNTDAAAQEHNHFGYHPPPDEMCMATSPPQIRRYFCKMSNSYPQASAQKRPAYETDRNDDWETTSGKRQRVDSGMGWSDAGSESQGNVKEEEDGESEHAEHHGERYNPVYQHKGWVAGANTAWVVDDRVPQHHDKGKGKGKEREREPEVVWLN